MRPPHAIILVLFLIPLGVAFIWYLFVKIAQWELALTQQDVRRRTRAEEEERAAAAATAAAAAAGPAAAGPPAGG
ncbi:hypothetical protein MMC24_000783 [Lignoscripta atroalba]|nr:hypothetical protein [Lignoscripta atroalba]